MLAGSFAAVFSNLSGLACVVLKPEYRETTLGEDIVKFLEGKVAKWMLPDKVVFIDEIPKTSVGKFNKKELRQRYLQF
ncbi:MAG: AMP-binding enzyme [Bacillota bacterium]